MVFIIIHILVSALGVWVFGKNSRIGKYFFNTLIAYDQLGNVFLLGGDPDETISSNTAKRQDEWFFKTLGKFLEWVDPGHLLFSIERDEGKDAVIR